MDDPTDTSKPLSGGRQRASHIQVHRIELSLPERKFIKDYLAANATADILKGVGSIVNPFGKAIGIIVGAIIAKEGVEALMGWIQDGLASRQNAINSDYEAYLEKYWAAFNAVDAKGNPLNPNATGTPMSRDKYEEKFGKDYLNNYQSYIAYPILNMFGFGDEYARAV